MADTYLHPSAAQLQAIDALPEAGPLVMVNLLRFAPDGGREQYERYGKAAAPFLADSGATLRYIGDHLATIIGGEEWDHIILVQYPTKQAFIDMTSAPGYPSEIRAGALTDSRLYCTQELG